MAGEVGYDSECCNWAVEDGPIEFSDDVGATLVLRYDYERTEISHTHFVIERFLDSGISDEDKVAQFKSYLTMVAVCSCSKQIAALMRVLPGETDVSGGQQHAEQ